jgi:hypothetical protein
VETNGESSRYDFPSITEPADIHCSPVACALMSGFVAWLNSKLHHQAQPNQANVCQNLVNLLGMCVNCLHATSYCAGAHMGALIRCDHAPMLLPTRVDICITSQARRSPESRPSHLCSHSCIDSYVFYSVYWQCVWWMSCSACASTAARIVPYNTVLCTTIRPCSMPQ